MLHRCFVHAGKTLIICKFWAVNCNKNAVGGRALPGPAGGAIALPQTPPIAVIRGKGGNGRQRKGLRTWREGRGLGKGVGRDGQRREGRTYGASTLTPSIESFWLRHWKVYSRLSTSERSARVKWCKLIAVAVVSDTPAQCSGSVRCSS